MLVFSEQDVIKYPPFSKLDLISCRNLLIYMGAELQKKLIPLFHYALNPDGFLFLGTSETVSDYIDRFVILSRKLKLYQRKEDVISRYHTGISRFLPITMPIGHALQATGKTTEAVKRPLRELTEQLVLKHVALAAALVKSNGDILYLHGRTGLYLEPAQGEAGVNNIIKMAREGLQHKLTTCLHKAAASKEVVRHSGLNVKTNGNFTLVNLTIHPVETSNDSTTESSLFLIILEEVPAEVVLSDAAKHMHPATEDTDARIVQLKEKLVAKEEYLQTANEELETSNEELKSSNEEMQSVNEDLQSTNEELETSKEELQSVNEELATVNAELQTKVLDLSQVNNDMNNLLAGTGIGTLFVDHHLRILRFTPAAIRIINLIPGDVGRPV